MLHCSFHIVSEGADGIVLGGGIWHPEAGPLAGLRRAVDRAPKVFKDVLRDEGIRREFLDKAGKTDAQVVKAFVKANAENALKTKPKVSDDLFINCDSRTGCLHVHTSNTADAQHNVEIAWAQQRIKKFAICSRGHLPETSSNATPSTGELVICNLDRHK
jgi:hypothetical protein